MLVNVSRGKLVDEAALVSALERGRLRGAALDVFEHEPLAPESPLWGRPDVLITPHVSGFHAHFWQDVTALFADNLRRFIAGQPLLNVVDKAAGTETLEVRGSGFSVAVEQRPMQLRAAAPNPEHRTLTPRIYGYITYRYARHDGVAIVS